MALVSRPSSCSSSSSLQHRPLPEARMATLAFEPLLGDATGTAKATVPCTGRLTFA